MQINRKGNYIYLVKIYSHLPQLNMSLYVERRISLITNYSD